MGRRGIGRLFRQPSRETDAVGHTENKTSLLIHEASSRFLVSSIGSSSVPRRRSCAKAKRQDYAISLCSAGAAGRRRAAPVNLPAIDARDRWHRVLGSGRRIDRRERVQNKFRMLYTREAMGAIPPTMASMLSRAKGVRTVLTEEDLSELIGVPLAWICEHAGGLRGPDPRCKAGGVRRRRFALCALFRP